MNEREVVAGLPLVTDEQAAETVVPAVGPLNDPASRLALDASDERLFAATTDVRGHVAIPTLALTSPESTPLWGGVIACLGRLPRYSPPHLHVSF